jgi:protein-disulfide isomerase
MSNTPEAPARRHKYRAAIGAGAIAGVAITTLWVVTAPVPAEIGGRKVAQATQSATEASKSSPAATSASPFSAEQKAAIEKIVTEYLIANPEFLMEIQNSLEAKMEKLQSEKLKVALKDNAKDIFKRASAPMAGNPNGDITVVEFFDYNCGYCKRALDDMSKLVAKDPKVKLVLMELPILSKGSEEGARIAVAAKLQGKYWEAHRALMALRGEINEQTGMRAVEKVSGIDIARLKRDLDSAEVKGEIALVRELARKMGINGTPHFLVGDRAISGAPGNLLEQISDHVADLRKTGCSVC